MTHRHIHSSAFSLRDPRLCAFAGEDLADIPQTLRSGPEMKRNPFVKTAMEFYEDKIRQPKYAELNEQPTRTYFLALLANGMLRDSNPDAIRPDYGNASRTDIKIADPLDRFADRDKQEALAVAEGLAKDRDAKAVDPLIVAADQAKREYDAGKAKVPPLAAADLAALKQKADDAEDQAKGIREGIKALDVQIAELRAGKGRFAQDQEAWENGGMPTLETRERTIEEFITIKKGLDAVLGSERIRLPQNQSSDAPGYGETLTREEYFQLLVLATQGHVDEIGEAAKRGLEGLREYIGIVRGIPRIEKALDRAGTVYRDFLPDEMGATETLKQHGVELGIGVRNTYWALRSGEISNPEILPPGESAAAWLSDPMRARAFLLNTDFPDTESNRKFLEDLQYFYEERGMVKEAIGPAGLSKAAVDATLNLIVQSLLETEKVLSESAKLRTDLKTKESLTEGIERNFGDWWEYLKDYRDHPLGSAVAATASLIVLKKLYHVLFKDQHNWFVRTGTYAAIIGLGVGLFQKEREGKAWWEDLWKKTEDWWSIQRKKDPNEQTLPSYWAHECKINDRQKRDCISLLEPQDSCAVMEWYGRMDVARKGKDIDMNRDDLKLPFQIDPQTREHAFGKMSDKDIALLFYGTIKDFCRNRGEACRLNGEDYGLSDPEAIGYRHLMDHYVKKHVFSTLLGGVYMRTPGSIKREPMRIQIDVDGEKRIYEVPGNVVPVDQLYIEEQLLRKEEEQDLSHAPMWNMFYLEMDPAILRRMGRENALPASVLEKIGSFAGEVVEAGHNVVVFGGRTWDMKIDPFLRKWTAEVKDKTGKTVRYVWENGKWLTEKGLEIAGPVIPNALLPDRVVAKLGGVPEDKIDAFLTKRNDIRSLMGNIIVQPSMRGASVEIGLENRTKIPFTGVNVPLGSVSVLYPQSMTLNDFLDPANTPDKILTMWKTKTLVPKQAELDAKPSVHGPLKLRMDATGTTIEVSAMNFGTNDLIARKEMSGVLTSKPEDLNQLYEAWRTRYPNPADRLANPNL